MNKIPEAVIFDFVGVVADMDYLRFFHELCMHDKIVGMKLLSKIKKDPFVKSLFSHYQTGDITKEVFCSDITKFLPNCEQSINTLLDNFAKHITINNEVIFLAKRLREQGIKTCIISNSIPETEKLLNEVMSTDAFDNVYASHILGIVKPSTIILRYVMTDNNLTPENTLLLDDKAVNVDAAKLEGMNAIKCKNSQSCCKILNKLLDKHTEQTFSKTQEDNFEK